MKTFIFLVLGLFFSHGILSAQEHRKFITPFTPRIQTEPGRKISYDPVTPHRPFTLSFGYGTNAYNRLNRAMNQDITINGAARTPGAIHSSTGAIQAAVGYEILPWLDISMSFVYLRNKGYRPYTFKDSWISFMPTARVSWIRHKNFSVYTRAGIGGSLANRKVYKDFVMYHTRGRMAWHVSPLGIEGGAGPVRFYAEGGYGYSGVFNCGIRFNIGKNRKLDDISQDVRGRLHEYLY